MTADHTDRQGDWFHFDSEKMDRWVLAFLTALADGPIGKEILEVAGGQRRIVVKQHPTLSGWIVETEAIALDSEGNAHSAYRTYPTIRANVDPSTIEDRIPLVFDGKDVCFFADGSSGKECEHAGWWRQVAFTEKGEPFVAYRREEPFSGRACSVSVDAHAVDLVGPELLDREWKDAVKTHFERFGQST